MYTLVLVTYATAFAMGPDVETKATRNYSIPPTFSVSVTKAGVYDNDIACNQIAGLIRDQETPLATYHIVPHCVELWSAPAGQPTASNQQ